MTEIQIITKESREAPYEEFRSLESRVGGLLSQTSAFDQAKVSQINYG